MSRDRISSVILAYHSLDETGRRFSTQPAMFQRQVAAILEGGLRPVSLGEVQTEDGSVAFTFDDGHRNFLEHALPVLIQNRVPATMFVASGYCGHAKGWSSRQSPDPADELMTWSELRQIAGAGIEIGAHTVLHRSLTSLPEAEALQEMRDSRLEIESRIGRPVRWFAYPYGHSDAAIRRLAGREFELACGTGLALVNERSDPFNLPRIFEFYLRSPLWLRRLNRVEGRAYVAARGCVARIRTALAVHLTRS